jgi:hypothetical protein
MPARTQCGDSGQPEREDLGKRGVRGYDAGKKVKGRKRHLLVDTQGLALGVKVLPAHLTDAEGGRELLEGAKGLSKRLSHLFVDGGYKRRFEEWVRRTLGWTVEVVRRPGYLVA